MEPISKPALNLFKDHKESILALILGLLGEQNSWLSLYQKLFDEDELTLSNNLEKLRELGIQAPKRASALSFQLVFQVYFLEYASPLEVQEALEEFDSLLPAQYLTLQTAVNQDNYMAKRLEELLQILQKGRATPFLESMNRESQPLLRYLMRKRLEWELYEARDEKLGADDFYIIPGMNQVLNGTRLKIACMRHDGDQNSLFHKLDKLLNDSRLICLLKSRLSLESGLYSQALRLIEEASSFAPSNYVERESEIIEYLRKRSLMQDARVPFTNHSSFARALYHRHHHYEAYMILREQEASDNLKVEWLQTSRRMFENVFQDIYYRYYGPVIMGLQVAGAATVLAIALFHLKYLGPSFYNLLLTVVAGVQNLEWLAIDIFRILEFCFVFVAFGPMLYLNYKMLTWNRSSRKTCYTEFHSGYLKISDFGEIHHLDLKNEDRDIYLYKDDNDYTYISLIRHIPLVPNLTYIYGYDLNRKIYSLVPLYGVADGESFEREVLKHRKAEVKSLNMIGVRLAQLATIFEKWNLGLMRLVPPILGGLILMGSNYLFHQLATPQFYFLAFFCFSIFLILYYQPSRTFRTLADLDGVGRLFTAPILKGGVLLLVLWFVSMHYDPYGASGWIPTLCLFGVFYFLFIRTRYNSHEKQIVAEVSSISGRESLFHHDLLRLPLGIEESIVDKEICLFANPDYLVLPYRLFGFHVFYEISPRQKGLELCPLGPHTEVKLGRLKVKVKESVNRIREVLDKNQIDYQLKESSLQGRGLPYMPILSLCTIWFSWQVYEEFLGETHTPKSDMVVQYDLKEDFWHQFSPTEKNNVFVHNWEGISYSFELGKDGKSLEGIPESLPNWEDFERNLVEGVNPEYRAQVTLAPFLRIDGFRDSAIDFVSWWLFRRHQKVDLLRYPQSYVSYCYVQGMTPRLVDNIGFRCVVEAGEEELNAFVRSQIPPEFLLADTRLATEAARAHGGEIYQYLPASQRSNPRVLDALVRKTPAYIKKLNLSNIDGEIISQWVLAAPMSYSYLPEKLQNNDGLIRLVIKQDPSMFEYLPDGVRSDTNRLMELLKIEPQIADYFDSASLQNLDFVKKISQSRPQVISKLETNNPEVRGFVMDLIKNNPAVLKHLPPQLSSDRSFILEAMEHHWWAFAYASRSLLNSSSADSSFKKKIRWNGKGRWNQVPSRAWSITGLMEFAIKDDHRNFNILSEESKHDSRFVATALKWNPRITRFFEYEHLKDYEILRVMRNLNWRHWYDTLDNDRTRLQVRNDRDLLMELVKKWDRGISYANANLRHDRALIRTAVKSHGTALQYVPDIYKNDLDTVVLAVKSDTKAIQYASTAVLMDPDFRREFNRYQWKKIFPEVAKAVGHQRAREL